VHPGHAQDRLDPVHVHPEEVDDRASRRVQHLPDLRDRRGGELVGGQGKAAPRFNFATLYRLREWRDGKFRTLPSMPKMLSASERPDLLFPEVYSPLGESASQSSLPKSGLVAP